jgi:hypothetical protein
MENLIRLVYIAERFKSSDRTLLFYTPRRASAIPEAFLERLRKLGQQVIHAVAFQDEPYMLVRGGIKLDAESHRPGTLRWGNQGLTKVGRPEDLQFKWICDAETWMDFADLVLTLVRGGSGHQYLRASPGDEAMVMVSRGEYLDEEFE